MYIQYMHIVNNQIMITQRGQSQLPSVIVTMQKQDKRD